jgi:hypothetical protein
MSHLHSDGYVYPAFEPGAPGTVTSFADVERKAAVIFRSLIRHRERYIRAWVAATGVHPKDAEIVECQELTANGVTMTVTIRSKQEALSRGVTSDQLRRWWDVLGDATDYELGPRMQERLAEVRKEISEAW